MLWDAVLLGSKLFHEAYAGEHFYDDFVNSESFKLLKSDTQGFDNEAAGVLKRFLNQWRTHFQVTETALSTAIEEAKQSLVSLKHASLLTAQFDRSMDNSIERAFEVIANCGKHYQATGASKILHMLNQQLFVMWDDHIRIGYGVDRTGKEYATRFLSRVQERCNVAVNQMAREEDMPQDEAISKLTSCGHTLAQVIDEFNFMKFTGRRHEVWDVEMREK